jgi:hypothetical protein
MWVVLTHDVSHNTRRFFEGLIMSHSLLMHGKENAPMDGL